MFDQVFGTCFARFQSAFRANNAAGSSTQLAPRALRFLEETHVKTIRQILVQIAPARIASLYELHCLDEILSQVIKNKVPRKEGIADLKVILSGIISISPDAESQVKARIVKFLGNVDDKSLAEFAADLAAEFKNDPASSCLPVLLSAATSRLVPETYAKSLTNSFSSAIAHFAVNLGHGKASGAIASRFSDAIEPAIHYVNQTIPANHPGRESMIEFLCAEYIPGIFSQCISKYQTNFSEKNRNNLSTFIRANQSKVEVTIESRQEYSKLYKTKLKDEMLPKIKELNSSQIDAVPKRDRIYIQAGKEALDGVQNVLVYEYEIQEGAYSEGLRDALRECLVGIDGLQAEVNNISPDVAAWVKNVGKTNSELSQTVDRIEEIGSEIRSCKARVAMFRQMQTAISPPLKTRQIEKEDRPEKNPPKEMLRKKGTSISEANPKAQERQLITLTYKFVDCKNEKYAIERKISNARLSSDDKALEDWTLKLDQVDSRIQFWLEQMQSHDGSKARIRSLSRAEKHRLQKQKAGLTVKINEVQVAKGQLRNPADVLDKTQELDKTILALENEISGLDKKIKKLEIFLKPAEEGGEYSGAEFSAFFA